MALWRIAYLEGCQERLDKLLRVREVLIHALAHEGVPEALEDGIGCLQDTLRMQHPHPEMFRSHTAHPTSETLARLCLAVALVCVQASAKAVGNRHALQNAADLQACTLSCQACPGMGLPSQVTLCGLTQLLLMEMSHRACFWS